MKKKIQLLGFFMFYLFLTMAQPPIASGEYIHLITDRDLYLNGEKIWYSGFYERPNDGVKKKPSQVIYLDLYNEDEIVVVKQKVGIEQGRITGSLDLPIVLSSGNYFLRAYTQYQRNFPPETWCTKWLTIINPRLPLNQSKAEATAFKGETVLPNKDKQLPGQPEFTLPLSLEVSTDKKVYGHREKVSLNVTNTQNSTLSDVTVSVVLKGTRFQQTNPLGEHLLNNAFLLPAYLFGNGYATIDKATAFTAQNETMTGWLPEIRGLTISGLIRNKSTKEPVADALCVASVLGEGAQVHMNRTSEDGVFHVTLHQLSALQNVVLSIDHPEADSMELLVQSDFANNFAPLVPFSFMIDVSDREVLEKMMLQPQLQEVFDLPEATPQAKLANLPFNIIDPEISISLKDYIKMPSLEEVINEFVPSLRARSGKNGAKLILNDIITNQPYEDPLVLLDKMPVTDIAALLKINPANIDKIEVINRQYILGDHTLNGVVMIYSNTENFAGIEIPAYTIFVEYQTLARGEAFAAPAYSTDTARLRRLPDFRTTLYWNPRIILQKEIKTLDFYTSDQQGTYEVLVRGRNRAGETVFGKTEIQVED